MTIPCKLVADKAFRAAVHLRSSSVPPQLLKSSAALFSAYGGAKPSLPDLKYDYGALARTLLLLLLFPAGLQLSHLVDHYRSILTMECC
jgi:hypothetical protein